MRFAEFARTLLLAALVLGAERASAQQAVVTEVPEITASASAEQAVRPNLAVVTLRFSRTGLTPSQAGRNLALATDSLRRALRPLGIPADSVTNASYWYWWRGRVERITTPRRIERWTEQNGSRFRADSMAEDTSYRASESLNVRIRDLSRVGAVIDLALALGITDIGDVAFSATNTENEQREAIRLATLRVRAHAETIALAGGVRLGRTIRLSTDASGGGTRYVSPAVLSLDALVPAGAEDSGGAAGNTLVVGPALRVSATVHGRWQLLEGNQQ